MKALDVLDIALSYEGRIADLKSGYEGRLEQADEVIYQIKQAKEMWKDRLEEALLLINKWKGTYKEAQDDFARLLDENRKMKALLSAKKNLPPRLICNYPGPCSCKGVER
jgi:sugar-specific transcriptional regulator TrmB